LSSRSVGLFSYTHSWFDECNTQSCRYERFDTNQLSGTRSPPYLPSCGSALTGHDFKLWIAFQVVSTLSDAFQSLNAYHFVVVFFLVLLPHSWSRRFAIDCTSHVCLDIQFHTITPSPNHALNIVASIAIWNRNRFAMVTALGLFGTNVAFSIQGKSLPLLLLA
jgi:hypothetical protein